MLTALSLGFRPRESGQLSTIIPHNHGITITYNWASVASPTWGCSIEILGDWASKASPTLGCSIEILCAIYKTYYMGQRVII